MLSGSNRVTLNELSEERLPYTRYARFGRQCSFKRVPRLLLKGSTFAFGGVHTLKLWPLMQPQKESRLWSNSLWGNKPTDNIHHLRWKSMITRTAWLSQVVFHIVSQWLQDWIIWFMSGDGRQPPDHKEMESGVMEQTRLATRQGLFCWQHFLLYYGHIIYRLQNMVEGLVNLSKLHIWR